MGRKFISWRLQSEEEEKRQVPETETETEREKRVTSESSQNIWRKGS